MTVKKVEHHVYVCDVCGYNSVPISKFLMNFATGIPIGWTKYTAEHLDFYPEKEENIKHVCSHCKVPPGNRIIEEG